MNDNFLPGWDVGEENGRLQEKRKVAKQFRLVKPKFGQNFWSDKKVKVDDYTLWT